MSDHLNNKRFTLDEPCQLSVEEYADLLSQIPDLSPDDRLLELWDAARYNDLDVLRAILKASSDDNTSSIRDTVNARQSDSGNTALHMACANGHLDIIEFLLHYEADPHISNSAGNTPLHWAASNGQEQACKLLLQRCKDMDVLQRNQFGRSALTEGFASGNENVVQSLLEHDSASEEKLLSTTGSKDAADGESQSVIHDMVFGAVKVKVRERSMACSLNDTILGSASEDTTGLGVWPASLVAAQWIAQDSKSLHEAKMILELGAGCGVPSLVAALSRPDAKVYATDWNSKSLDNLSFNCKLNSVTIETLNMDWGDKRTWPPEKIELLIGSDLIYMAESVPLLVSTVQGLLSKTGRFLYVVPTTLSRQGKDEFLEEMKVNFDMTCLVAPAEFTNNPLASGDDDECFLHFNELQSTGYMLYKFTWKDQLEVDEL